MVEFPKISIKTKHCKTFYEAETATNSWGNYCTSPNQIKSYYSSGKKCSYGDIQKLRTSAIKGLQECSSWASRNDAVAMFFLTPNRKTLSGKFVK